jgi:hypothetical protein
MIDDLFDQMKGTTVFSKIDLIAGYHRLWIKEDNIPKTTFNMSFLHYDFIFLPFGLMSPRCIYEFDEQGVL